MLKQFKNELLPGLKGTVKKLIILDYDGTLVNHENRPEVAIPSEQLLYILKSLSEKSNTDVFVISGRKFNDIEDFFGSLSINLISDHGAMIKENGIWKDALSTSTNWKESVKPILDEFTNICPGSLIEEKKFSLAWHYRNVTENTGQLLSRQLIDRLQHSVKKYNLKVLDGNKVVEILMNNIGKGIALKNILSGSDYDYILCIGDDKTDEEMFELLGENKNADTIKVGEGKSAAKYRLNNVKEVISLLNEIVNAD